MPSTSLVFVASSGQRSLPTVYLSRPHFPRIDRTDDVFQSAGLGWVFYSLSGWLAEPLSAPKLSSSPTRLGVSAHYTQSRCRRPSQRHACVFHLRYLLSHQYLCLCFLMCLAALLRVVPKSLSEPSSSPSRSWVTLRAHSSLPGRSLLVEAARKREKTRMMLLQPTLRRIFNSPCQLRF